MSASTTDPMGAADSGSRSRLRRLARDYESGAITRADYRERRRHLIESFTEAPLDGSQATTMTLGPMDDPFGHAVPGAKPLGSDLTQALSARPLTQFKPLHTDRDKADSGNQARPAGTGDTRGTPSLSRRKSLSGALLAAAALVASATVVGIVLAGLLGA